MARLGSGYESIQSYVGGGPDIRLGKLDTRGDYSPCVNSDKVCSNLL